MEKDGGTGLKDCKSDELFEFESELVPELPLVQICKRVVPFCQLRMGRAQ